MSHQQHPADALLASSPAYQAPQATSNLLQRAQMLAHQEAAADPTDDLADASQQKLREVLHDLRVHQIELEMQNEELRRLQLALDASYQIELEMQNHELRRTQAALDTAQARFFDFFDLAPVAYLTVGDQAVILKANLTAETLLGHPRDRLIGKVFPAFLSPAEADNYYLLCKKVLATGSTQSCELQICKPDGATVWVHLLALAASGDDGAAVIRMVLSDISERKQSEANLLASTQLRNAILDSVPSQIAVLDYTGTILAVNQVWQKFAMEHSTVPGQPTIHTQIGANYLAICQSASGDASLEAMQAYDGILQVINGTLPHFQLEYACHTPMQQRWFLMVVTPLHKGNHAVVVTHTDITQRRLLEQAAKEASESKFRLVADNTSDGIVIFDEQGQISYVSPGYVKQLGYQHEADLLKLPLDKVYALIHPDDREGMMASIKCAIQAQAPDHIYTYRVRNGLGHYVWREANAKYQYDVSGNFSGSCAVVRDITQRRQAEEAMRIAAVAFETHEAMVITDINRTILQVNQAFTRTTGYSSVEAVGQISKFLRSDRHDEAFYLSLWETARRTGSWQGEIWDRHKDGSVCPKWLTLTAVKSTDSSISHYVYAYVDLTERKRTEAAMQEMNRDLTQSRQQLRRLVALNETRLEQEKQHIAREVHDELGQVLTALRLGLSLTVMRHASVVPELVDELHGLKTLVDRGIQGVRNVATSLHPTALDMGLVAAIEWLADEFSRYGEALCQVKVPDETITLEPSRAIVVFRIVQESLTNIRKYARASQVNICLMRCDAELSVVVRDNGVGFDVAAVAQRGTLGLLGMRERVLALGGRVEVGSTPGHGTTIAVVIPLETNVPTEQTWSD